MIGGPKRIEIKEALYAAFPTRGAIIDLLDSIAQDYGRIEVVASPLPENIARVIECANTDGWLLALMAKASSNVAGDDVLRTLLDELRPILPPPGIDHFQVCRLSGAFLMLDRAPLRTSLQGINTQLGKRILVVRGRRKAGKTHTGQFISYLADALRQFSYILIDLEAFTRLLGPGVPVEPNDIAGRLVSRLGYDMIVKDPPANGPWAHWILDFCDTFESKATDDAAYRWVVIDAFNSVVATQNTLDLVKELSIRVSQTLTRFRLVLLGFDADLPPEVEPHLDREDIGPIWIGEMTEYFASAFAQQSRQLDEDEVVEAAVRVLAGLDPAREDFLAQLMPRVSDELARPR